MHPGSRESGGFHDVSPVHELRVPVIGVDPTYGAGQVVFRLAETGGVLQGMLKFCE